MDGEESGGVRLEYPLNMIVRNESSRERMGDAGGTDRELSNVQDRRLCIAQRVLPCERSASYGVVETGID